MLLKASSYIIGGLGANIVMFCKLSHPAKVSMPICLRLYFCDAVFNYYACHIVIVTGSAMRVVESRV